VVQFAKGKGPQPPELRAAWWGRTYHALPRPGAVYDQDYREMILNDSLTSIDEAVYNWRHNSMTMSEDDRQTILWLVKIGAL